MKKVKWMLAAGAVALFGVMGFLIYTMHGNRTDEVILPPPSPAEETTETETDVSPADRQPGLSDTEFMSAVVSEDGVPTLSYYNKTTVSGAPDLVIPAKKNGLSIVDVDVLWLKADETTPVTYLQSITWEDGIRNVDGNIDCCTSLKEAVIPKSVKKLPPHAFEGSAETVVLRVAKGSYGEKYAKEHKLKFEYLN